jgi:pilus assembly protein CpaB
MNQQIKTAGLGTIGFLVAALICAGFTTYLVAMLLRDKGLRREPTAMVLVASRDVRAGTKLTKADVRVIEIVAAQIPPGAVTAMSELFGDKKPAPLAATGMVTGDFIMRSRLADSANGTAMAARLEPGFRAIAVTVDNAIARSRLVYPGARVDLVGTFRDNLASFSRVLVENVRVLSLEDQTDVETTRNSDQKGDRSNNAVVTVEVSPEQAEVVALAAREGKLDVVLRNANDEKLGLAKGVRTEQILRANPAEASAARGTPERMPPREAPARPRRATAARPPERPERIEVKREPPPPATIEVVRRQGGDQ